MERDYPWCLGSGYLVMIIRMGVSKHEDCRRQQIMVEC